MPSPNGARSHTKAKVNILPVSLPGEESESTAANEAGETEPVESSQAANETADNRSEKSDKESEEKCYECVTSEENCLSPQGIEVQASTDKILVLPEEILGPQVNTFVEGCGQ